MEHMFFKGTKTRTAEKIRQEFDRLGAGYNAYTSEESTAFYVQAAAEDFEKSLELIADLFLNPAFPDPELEREKGVILEEANMRRDIPQLHVQTLAQAQVFADYSLGHDLIGTPESVKGIGQSDIWEYFKKGYSPESTIVVICGNPKNFDWEKMAEAAFLKMEAIPAPACEKLTKMEVAKPVVQDLRKVDQAHFVLSALAVSKTDPRRYAMSIFSTILGANTSSRLFSEIREKRGWAYYISSEVAAYHDIGAFAVSGGVKQDELEESVAIILREIRDLAENGPKKEELERAKTYLRGQLALSLEETSEIAAFVADEIFYQGKVRQPEEIVENLFKVTPDAVKEVSKMLLEPARMGLAVVGPKEYRVGL